MMTLDSFSEWFMNLEDTDKAMVWNEYAREKDPNNEIYGNDEDFFNTFFYNNPMEAVRSSLYGSYNFIDTYVMFDGNGNLKTTFDLPVFIYHSLEEMFEYFSNNKDEIKYLPNHEELLDD